MTTDLDLRELAVDRSQRSAPQHRSKRRPLISRYLVPGAIGLGLAALVLWAAGAEYLPRTPVTVVPVVVARAESQPADTPLFQAAGWIEPRPTPVLVTALTRGVIEQLLVVEGQEVAAGEPVARLVDADAQIALDQARANLALREAELSSVEAELEAARLRHEHPVHLEAALAEADSLLAKTETELAKIPYLLASAEASVAYAEKNLTGKRAASSAIARRSLEQAESEYATASAQVEELRQRRPRLEREADALRRKRAALETQRRLLIEERRSVAEGEARLRAAEARRDQARLAVRQAELDLERTVIKTPVAGRVLELIAQPGTRVMGMAAEGASDSSSVVSLYDPAMLQVRADVRLEDVPMIQLGQPVEIETASSKTPLRGKVLYATSAANIQKNTLEVKVAIEDPPSAIRPEMLVTATFLSPPQPENASPASEAQERLLVPRQLVQSIGDEHVLWIADASGIARRRRVRLGTAGTDALVEVVEGLTITDKLIAGGREGLEDGERVRVRDPEPSVS